MLGKRSAFSEESIYFVEEIEEYMPGGFFIYKADESGTLLYANRACCGIFGCGTLEEFKALTGFTFRGMVYPEDYETVTASIEKQISTRGNNMDYVEYRIVRRDGEIRWVDDNGHFTDTEAYGGIYCVFISDITAKRARRETDLEIRDAVIRTLTGAYNTVWLINDVETEYCSLFHTDSDGIHAEAIRNALSHAKYSDTKTEYVQTMVAEEDRERMQEQISLPYILKQFESRNAFSVNFMRNLKDGPRHYRIDFGKVNMPGGRTGVTMGFKDADLEVREGRALQKALQDAKKTEEENKRLLEEVESAAKIVNLMGFVTSLLTNMPAMSFSKDAETGIYLACNQAFAEYAGKKSPEEVTGLDDFALFDPETAAHFAKDDQKALGMDEAYVYVEDVPDAAGTAFRNLQTTKTKFTDPSGRLCLLGMCVDVTEMTRIKTAEAESRAKQQELEERLALQEKLLEQEKRRKEQDAMITAMASDYRSVYHVDLDTDDAVCYRADPGDSHQTPEGVHFPFHARFQEYCSLYVDKEYEKEFLAFIEPENIRKALSAEDIIAFRYLARRNGAEYYEMLRMAGVRHPKDRDDHIVHAVGVGFTVIDAEMRETMDRNRALKEALNAAEQANRAKTAFLSNMSHEIRTPMNAIIGLNNIALNEPDIPDRITEYLKKTGAAAQHLLGIINDILDMTRIESGKMTVKHEEFSFARGMDQVNTIVAGQCRDKGLTYEYRTVGKIDDYYIGDEMKLKQVIINILGNAVKFTPKGGKVSCCIEEGPRYDRKATLKITVSDTGIGISKEYLPHIFEAFTQEDASSTNKYGSTGLGMPITKSIVEMMNGHIEVESERVWEPPLR
ncbi:MAG: PAS domain S-box protein [Eubacterium sp.]|nr:PAS domain S-box protein [Eubacterium sp.]